MTKTFLKGALLAAVAIVATPAAAEPFKATANIVKPLAIVKNTDLNFGTITMQPSLASSAVTVAASSGATASCGANLTCSAGTSNPGWFTVNGVGTQTVTLSYGALVPTTLVNTTDSTKSVPFTLNGASNASLVNGTGDFYVGGSITVASTTAPGAYSADLDVTASYQ